MVASTLELARGAETNSEMIVEAVIMVRPRSAAETDVELSPSLCNVALKGENELELEIVRNESILDSAIEFTSKAVVKPADGKAGNTSGSGL